MANKEGYPWPCQRDGMNVREIAERPTFAQERTHEEWHNSETGRPEEPKKE